jgi:hypothetical protein
MQTNADVTEKSRQYTEKSRFNSKKGPEEQTTQSISYKSSSKPISLNLQENAEMGKLKFFIKDEISRLESLYKNIENMMFPSQQSQMSQMRNNTFGNEGSFPTGMA